MYTTAFVGYFRQIVKMVVHSSASTGLFLFGLAKLSVSGLFVVVLRSIWLLESLEQLTCTELFKFHVTAIAACRCGLR